MIKLTSKDPNSLRDQILPLDMLFLQDFASRFMDL